MLELLRLFKGEQEEALATQADFGAESVQDMQAELRDLILDLLAGGGVPAGSVEVEARLVGKARDGRHVFLGMLRLVQWHRKGSLRLMIGLPLLEHALRRRLRGSWLEDVSHFGGLWLHPSGQMLDDDIARELRALMQALESSDSPAAAPNESMWSLPPELGGSGPSSG